MTNFNIREIITDNIQEELSKIGFDSGYLHKAQDKFKYKNIKIYSISPAQANILKQTALTVGAECATHRDVISGKTGNSDAILTGSISQLHKISEKLKSQPFKLGELGNEIIKLTKDIKRSTKIVGILNITPDSFSDGGLYFDSKSAIKHFEELVNDGADMIDIGAETTKPYSNPVEPSIQIERLSPVLAEIQNCAIPISVDTRSSEVADFALNNGANIINDVSGFDFDNKMAETVAKYHAGIILQHSLGTPENMQNSPTYNDVITEIYFKLKEKAEYAESLGIKNIILDPGIGFGKTKEHNLEILNKVEEFYSLNYPIMIGHSRKSFLGADATDKDSMTLAFSYGLILKNVDYIRVHNVKLHKQLLNILNL